MTKIVSTRLNDEELALLDKRVAELKEQCPEAQVTISSLVRFAVSEYVEDLKARGY